MWWVILLTGLAESSDACRMSSVQWKGPRRGRTIFRKTNREPLIEITMKKIQITRHQHGTQEVEVLGPVGADCLELTRQDEKRPGAPVGRAEIP